MRYVYPAVITPAEEGGFIVDFPDFPCCATEGDDQMDAINMAAEALELAIESEVELGHSLPRPGGSFPDGETPVYISVDVDTRALLVRTADAASMLGVTPSRVRQMVLSGQLASEKRGRDTFVFLWSIRKRLEEQGMRAGQKKPTGQGSQEVGHAARKADAREG